MGSAWNYSAKERSADGKFSAEFEGHEIAMGAPSLGELRLYASAELLRGDVNFGDANAQMQGLDLKRKKSENVKFSQSGEIEQILLSEQATACFTFSDDSRFLAFAEWTADKMQLVKVLRLADMSLKTVDGLQRVVEFYLLRTVCRVFWTRRFLCPKAFGWTFASFLTMRSKAKFDAAKRPSR